MKTLSLEDRFKEKNLQGKKALIPFLPAGYPSLDRFWDYIYEMDRLGADIIEIGVPFSDPVADGEVVERASNVALENGVNLKWILKELKKRREDLGCGIVLMGYCNPFFKYGWEKLAEEASEAGVNGIIIADMPLEESLDLRVMLQKKGISLIYLVGLNTSLERMRLYSEKILGFVYFVSVLGITGARDRFPLKLKTKLKEARKLFSSPLALGFGIKEPSQLKEIDKWLDGVVFGSALIQHINKRGEIKSFFEKWK